MYSKEPKLRRCLLRTLVAVLVVAAATILGGCVQESSSLPESVNIQISNLRAREHGVLNKKVEVSCDVTNSGGSGLATLTAYVAYEHEVYDSASKTIRIGAGQQIAVSFDLDIKDLGGQYDYWVS